MQALTEEYVAYVDAMRGGQYADSDEWQRLSSERILVHDAGRGGPSNGRRRLPKPNNDSKRSGR